MKAAIRKAVGVGSVIAVAAAVAAPAHGDGQAKRAGCDISGIQQNLGASYVNSVKARNLSCGKAIKLVKKYHQCRKDHGGADGKCNGFKGYSCKEKKLAESPAQYTAKAKCTKGSKKFVQNYTQNT